jgi:hypothetical protein
MKAWIAANLFFVGMSAFAAGLFFAWYAGLQLIPLNDTAHRAVVFFLSIGTLIVTGYAGRAVLRFFARR